MAGLRIAAVACGDAHTLVVTEGGELFSFGRNQNGQLGVGTTEDGLSPQRVVAGLEREHVSSIACGSEHSVIATNSGQVTNHVTMGM